MANLSEKDLEELKKSMKLKSFDFASSVSKQLITLSTTVFTITLTFSEYLNHDNSGNYKPDSSLLISWVLFIISVLFGVWTLLALAGSLDCYRDKKRKKKNNKIVSIYDFNVGIPAFFQILSFLAAMGFAVKSIY